jgi:hypothetical protein
MVDDQVVKRPRDGHRFLKTQHFGLIGGTWLNGDRAGPLGERGDSWSGRSRSGMWQAGTSKVVAPHVSINDRLVGPHEQVLNYILSVMY